MNCGCCSTNTTLKCGVCGRAGFCSIECQRRIWKIHRLQCNTIPSDISPRQPDLLKSELELSLQLFTQQPHLLEPARRGFTKGFSEYTGFQIQELYDDQLKIIAAREERSRHNHMLGVRSYIYKYAPLDALRKIWKEKPIYPYYELARIEAELITGCQHKVGSMQPILNQYFTFYCLQDQLPGDLHLSVHDSLYDSAFQRLLRLMQGVDFKKMDMCGCGCKILIKHMIRATSFYGKKEEVRDIVQRPEYRDGKPIIRNLIARPADYSSMSDIKKEERFEEI